MKQPFDIFNAAERGMGMSSDVWERHANPWSVWTRFTCLPLLVLAIWSRVWLGWWSLAPIALACLWIWLNPRVFPPPKSTDNWASKGVMGERVFLNRGNVPVPDHHRRWAIALGALSTTGLPPLVWGLWSLDATMTLLGLVLLVLPKVWFVDRMVWLFEDTRTINPEYQGWLR